jgi:aryl-alcohol dehydrogenase-like predicted oxidoreductase
VLEHRRLGASELSVSVLALGSWRTWERIPHVTGAAVLSAAREGGIDFLEVARYNDETGTAPLPTGYSEVVFGEVFRASGWPRDEVTIANKLWWEFWPQTPAAELDASLLRTGLDHFDFIYSDPPPAALPIEEVLTAVGALVQAGKVRAWGIVNWPAERIAAAGRAACALGVPAPCAAQLAYSVAARSPVEDADMRAALASCDGARVVASYVLAGGVLSGKYAAAGGGRMAAMLDDERLAPALRAAARLRALAAEWGTAPAALAIAFALGNPDVATVLFGATSPEQLAQNLRAVELGADRIAALRSISV